MADEKPRLWHPGDVHNGWVFTQDGTWLRLAQQQAPPEVSSHRTPATGYGGRYARRWRSFAIPFAVFFALLPLVAPHLGVGEFPPAGIVDALIGAAIGVLVYANIAALIAAIFPMRSQ